MNGWEKLSSKAPDGMLTLKLNLVLDNKGLTLVVKLLGELGRDGMMSSRVLDNETLVTFHALELNGLLNGPLANIGPLLFLFRASGVLLGMGWLPTLLPAIGELLEEVRLDGAGLESHDVSLHVQCGSWNVEFHSGAPTPPRFNRGPQKSQRALQEGEEKAHTVKVGRSGMTGDTSSSAWATPAKRPAETAAATALNFIVKNEGRRNRRRSGQSNKPTKRTAQQVRA